MDPYNGNSSVLVDERLGTSYQVIREVHAALSQILFLADNMDQLSPRQIELRQSVDMTDLQWRREGDVNWKQLISVKTLAASMVLDPSLVYGLDDVTDNKSYTRSQGIWKELPQLFSGKYADLAGLPDLFSGKYVDLSGLPDLFSGKYADLTGLPDLFSGKYADLSGKPELFSGAYGDLSGKPDLFSGAYADLSGKPDIPDAQVQTDWNATQGLGAIKNKPTVATLVNGKVPASQLPASSGSSGGFTPMRIEDGASFIVPEGFQAFMGLPVTVEGILQIDGYLIEV